MASGSGELSGSARRVQEALESLGLVLQVVELPSSTRSASEAASAIGCSVEQIAKSLVFRGVNSGDPILVVASGGNRVDEQLVGAALREPIERADADYVRARTGFAIGGVPPLGHRERLRTFVDEDLLQYSEIWAAAGTPNAVFRLTPPDLLHMSGAYVIRVRQG